MIYKTKSNSYYASEIAQYLDLPLVGENCEIYQPCSSVDPKNNSVMFLTNSEKDRKYDFERVNNFSDFLAILPDSIRKKPQCSYLISKKPQLDFTRMLYKFFVEVPIKGIHPQAVIEENAKIGDDVSIGAGCFIGHEVHIGNHTIISNNTVITGKVTIGKNCVIKPNATIGSEGFNFLFDRNNLIHMPQLGEIVIKDYVWIGANSTIERSSLDQTVIESYVKIDDLVQIGDGTIVGESSEIAAGSILCARVCVGEKCWIAPNVTINSDLNVGDGAVIGIGSVVLRDVEANVVVCGNPASILKKKK